MINVLFKILSVALFAWGVANTALSMTKYGLESGMYFWFCNIALLLSGPALWLPSRSLLVGLFSVACFTETLWIVDNLYRLIFHDNLFGMVEFIYQPGMPGFEFLLSHYHYFLIPTWILALCLIPKQPKNRSWLYVIVGSFLICGASYFFFSREENVNCIHEPCFPSVASWGGVLYTIVFFILITGVSLAISWGSDRFFGKIVAPRVKVKPVLATYFAFVALAALVTLADVTYKSSLPSFRCEKPMEDSRIKIDCRYTYEFDDNLMKLAYRVTNKTSSPMTCTTQLDYYGQYEPLHPNVALPAHSSRTLAMLIPYPKKSVVARIAASCVP